MSDKDKLSAKLASLKPNVRARLETELLAQIERQIATSVLDQGPLEGSFDRQHDRGPLFGKDFDRQASDVRDLREIASLDDAEFTKFADRLSILRAGIKPGA
jgi:hypothetical protein